MADSISDLEKAPCYWQRLLRLGGYYEKAIDGVIGTDTQSGAQRWAADAARYKRETGEFDERTERNLSTLLPEAQKAARQWFQIARVEARIRGYEVKIICGTRTYAEQDALFQQRPKVTNARGGQSWHNFGLAWDFGIFQGNKYLGDHPLYSVLGSLHTQVARLDWGGRWKSFVDLPHLQLNKFGSIAEARQCFETSTLHHND